VINNLAIATCSVNWLNDVMSAKPLLAAAEARTPIQAGGT
jgi:hypothetical protein